MKNASITEFVNKLSSKEPTPGGGAAAGVAAGLGVAAIMMAIEFSNTDKLDEDVQTLLTDTLKQFDESKVKFLDIINRDADEFMPLSRAYGMPRATDEEKEARSQAIQEGLVTASQAPLDLIKGAVEVVEQTEKVLPHIKKGIVSDVGVGLQMLRSAMTSSSLNVYINAGSLKDEALVEEYISGTEKKLAATTARIDDLFTKVNEIIRPNS